MAGSPVARAFRRALVGCVAICGAAALLLALTEASPAPRQHLSPNARYAAVLASDTYFGQVEYLRVLAAPGTPEARVVFEVAGDTPLRFLRWHEARMAELEFPPQGGEPAYRLRLACGDETCTLDRAPIEWRQ